MDNEIQSGLLRNANRIYRDMALIIGADTTIADSLMGRGSENRALMKAIKEKLNELV
jgi:hypothetical protein